MSSTSNPPAREPEIVIWRRPPVSTQEVGL